VNLSPFSEEHDLLRRSVADWVDAEIAPHVADWEAAGDFPDEVFSYGYWHSIKNPFIELRLLVGAGDNVT
jgi:alkylation response protein AidB-like acyl-CoA dehydrogenase